VSGKDARCLFINNGDDLLTLKKVVSKKTDKDEVEKQKNNKSKETNNSELNGNHNKTDSINFDIDNTSSLEPNLEMDSDTDRNITIDSICTQDDQESENIDVSNENSNEADIKTSEKDIQAISIKCSDIPYSPSDSLDDNEYSHNLENDDDDLESNNIKSPLSYLNISARAPLHSNSDFESTLEDEILPLEEIEFIRKKRKFEGLHEQEQKSNKALRIWNIMKYPFQKITVGGSVIENKGNISEAQAVIEDEEEHTVPIQLCENDSNNSEEMNEPNNTDIETEVNNASDNTIKKNFEICNLM